MTQNTDALQKWTLVSEIVGALAIVISLLFVAYEIRQNTSSNYASTLEALNRVQIEWRTNLLSTPGLLDGWEDMLGVPIEPAELVSEQLLLIYELAFFSRKYGRIGEDEWSRYRDSMCSSLAGKAFSLVSSSNFTKEFFGYLQDCRAGE
jgi:hypothetical protein